MACSSMVASCHNPTINYKNRADGRTRTLLSLRFFLFLQRRAHKALISLCSYCHGKINSCVCPVRQRLYTLDCANMSHFFRAKCQKYCVKSTHVFREGTVPFYDNYFGCCYLRQCAYTNIFWHECSLYERGQQTSQGMFR